MKIINKMKKNEYFLIKNFLFLAGWFILIIVVSGIIICYNFISTNDEKIMENAHNSVTYVSNTSEKMISEINNLVRYISSNDSINYLLYNKGADSGFKNTADAVKNLKLMTMNNDSVQSIYIYNKNDDYLTTTGGTLPLKYFDDLGWREIYESLERNETGLFFRKSKDSDVYIMSFICRVIKNEYNDSGIVINIDMYRFMDFCENTSVSAIYSPDNGEIIYNSGYIMPQNELSEILLESDGIFKSGDSYYVMAKMKSNVGDFEYVSLEKLNDYRRSKILIYSRVILVLFVMMLIFMLIAFEFSNSAYETIRIIGEISENPTTKKYNKYLESDVNTKKIVDTIFRVVSTNERLYEKLGSTMKNYSTAQLKALQLQINPHFIFNTLTTLYYISDREAGEDNDLSNGILSLSELMRYSLKAEPVIVTLKEEMKAAEKYIKLMRFRYKDKFDVIWNIDEKFYNRETVKLCLQPILENSFSYAVKNAENKIYLEISAYEEEGFFRLSLSDNGKGMPKNKFEKIEKSLNEEADFSEMHIGLMNVHNRIRLLYGTEYGLKIINKNSGGLTVILNFPL